MGETTDRKFERWRSTGDTHALSDVFDEIAPRLLRLATHLVGDVAAAEDLVQATFVVAIEAAHMWDAARPLEPWLTGILDRRAKELLKSRNRSLEPAAREDVDLDTPLARAIERETYVELVKAVDQLEEPYRSVMVLSLLHHLEPAAIAHALDRSPGAVRVQLHRGREMVRKLLPAGVLTSAVLVAGSGRGIAAIKAAVMSQANVTAGISIVATTGGLIVLKKLIIAATVLLLLAVGTVLMARARLERNSARGSTADVELASGPGNSEDPLTVRTVTEPLRSPAIRTGTLTVSGRVIDTRRVAEHTGTPASSCELVLTLLGAQGTPLGAPIAVKTDDRGTFQIQVAKPDEAPVFVRAQCPVTDRTCSVEVRRRLDPAKDVIENVVLERVARGMLRGVTLGPHDEPLAGVHVGFAYWGENSSSLECVSDARGAFEMQPPAYGSANLVAELAGWSTFEGFEAVPDPAGGWRDATIVLAPRGVLRVHVMDALGSPVVNERVRVEAAPSEPGHRVQYSVSTTNALSLDTGADGIATFENLWVGKRLAVEIGRFRMGDTWMPVPRERMQAGVLVTADTAGSEPIVIGPSGVLHLRSVREPDVLLHGVVLRPDRLPASGAAVEVREADAVQSSTRLLGSARSEADGRFSISVARGNGTGSLRITAAEAPWETENWMSDEDQPMRSAGSLIWDPRTMDPDALEIVLAPMLSIAGQVIVAEGSLNSGRVTAVPAGAASWLELPGMGRICIAEVAKDGKFRIENLPAGRYDLRLSGGSARAWFEQRFQDIEAGRNDVRLVVDAGLAADVHIRATSKHGVVAKLIVMQGRIVDVRGSSVEAAELPPDLTVRSLAGWPCEAPLGLVGAGGRSDGNHQAMYVFSQCAAAECDVTPKVSGSLYLGIEAELADGRRCFPMSTGLVHVGPGAHTITFEVVPTADVEGHVRGLDSASLYSVALLDEAGSPLPLFNGSPARAQLSTSGGLRDDGWFRIAGAPVGRFQLCIGTREQLARGAFVCKRAIDVTEKGPPLDVDASR